jgi:dienelactone hydrolase
MWARLRSAAAGIEAALLALLAIVAVWILVGALTGDSVAERADLLARNAQYYAPAAGGRAPLVILSSGCGGVVGAHGPNRVMNNYAEAAARGGAYAIIVDGLQARGIDRDAAIRTVCSGIRLRGGERAGDIVAGGELARRHWGDRFTGVILAGWSHGAWTVMELLSNGAGARRVGSLRVNGSEAALKPDAVILYYPYCGLMNRAHRRPKWTFNGPLVLVTAELDTMGPEEKCLPLVQRNMADPSTIRHVDAPGQTHAFDEEMQSADSKFVYDPKATARSEQGFSAFVADQAARLRDREAARRPATPSSDPHA